VPYVDVEAQRALGCTKKRPATPLLR